MVTLWQANEGFKVLRPSGLEKFQFSSIVPKIFAQIMKFYFFFSDAELLYQFTCGCI